MPYILRAILHCNVMRNNNNNNNNNNNQNNNNNNNKNNNNNNNYISNQSRDLAPQGFGPSQGADRNAGGGLRT